MYRRRDILTLASAKPARSLPESGPKKSSGYWLHVSRTAMACRFEVTFPDNFEAGVGAASAALDEVARIESQLSVYREESELSQLNRRAGSGAVGVEPGLYRLLERCRDLAELTGGAFDITAGPLSRIWGFTRREGRVPTVEEIEAARARVGSGLMQLDGEARTVRLMRQGMEINPGGVGKGYALDRVAARMRAAGVPALLTAGFSSMLAVGQFWTVGISHPRRAGQRLAVIRLRDLALATSGSEEQYFERGGIRYGHIIDPRSGWPAPAGASVTVVTTTATDADALATGFYAGGRQMAEDYCAAHPGTLVVLLEAGSARPVVIGGNSQCEVTILNEQTNG